MASSKKYIRAGRISMHKNDLQKDVKKQIATDWTNIYKKTLQRGGSSSLVSCRLIHLYAIMCDEKDKRKIFSFHLYKEDF